jgi:hypothetical protein
MNGPAPGVVQVPLPFPFGEEQTHFKAKGDIQLLWFARLRVTLVDLKRYADIASAKQGSGCLQSLIEIINEDSEGGGVVEDGFWPEPPFRSSLQDRHKVTFLSLRHSIPARPRPQTQPARVSAS